MTTAHHPQMNVDRMNQCIVTRLKCKVNSTTSKAPWTKLLQQVTEEYNNTSHSIKKFLEITNYVTKYHLKIYQILKCPNQYDGNIFVFHIFNFFFLPKCYYFTKKDLLLLNIY